MDRTEEFCGILQVLNVVRIPDQKHDISQSNPSGIASKISISLGGNDSLLSRIKKLYEFDDNSL